MVTKLECGSSHSSKNLILFVFFSLSWYLAQWLMLKIELSWTWWYTPVIWFQHSECWYRRITKLPWPSGISEANKQRKAKGNIIHPFCNHRPHCTFIKKKKNLLFHFVLFYWTITDACPCLRIRILSNPWGLWKTTSTAFTPPSQVDVSWRRTEVITVKLTELGLTRVVRAGTELGRPCTGLEWVGPWQGSHCQSVGCRVRATVGLHLNTDAQPQALSVSPEQNRCFTGLRK